MKKGLSANAIKMIACIIMFIDHIGMVVMYPYVLQNAGLPGFQYSLFKILYRVIRGIGRMAFPLFCFFIIEGFFHTKNKIKYAFRLFLFALISEIPFDFAVKKALFDFSYQNVYFTLLLGYLCICTISKIRDICRNLNEKSSSYMINTIYRICFEMLCVCIFLIIGLELRVDYSYEGVLCIIAMYFASIFLKGESLAKSESGTNDNENMKISDIYNKLNAIILFIGIVILTIFNTFEIFALFALIFILSYNGERGRGNKFLFYAFYPAHLLFLSGVWVFYTR